MSEDKRPVCGDHPCEHLPPHVTLEEDRAANPEDYGRDPEDCVHEHARCVDVDTDQCHACGAYIVTTVETFTPAEWAARNGGGS